MDTQTEKTVVNETDVFDASGIIDNKSSEQTRDESYVMIPNDFTLNDQVDVTQQLDQNDTDATVEDGIEEENEDLLDDEVVDSTQTNNDSDSMVFMDSTMDGNDDALGSAADGNNQLDPDTDEVKFLGEDMEESILDSSARIGLDTDVTQQNTPIIDDDDFQQQHQHKNDEEDETVEKTWDMDGDDVDDDQENSSVDALLDAGEDSFDSDNNIDHVINDDSFVVDELADTLIDNKSSSSTGDIDGQRDWSNENVDSTRGGSDSNLQEDGQQSWNEDDDTEAEAEEEQEETMEQGTVEENENDRLGATLENALDALELEQDTPSPPSTLPSLDAVGSENDIVVDDTTRANGLYDANTDTTSLIYDDLANKSAPIMPLSPPQQQIGEQAQTTSSGLDSADDPASVDTSLILLVAIFILLCLRLPYVKRFFVKLFKTQESATLPYHVAPQKELD